MILFLSRIIFVSVPPFARSQSRVVGKGGLATINRAGTNGLAKQVTNGRWGRYYRATALLLFNTVVSSWRSMFLFLSFRFLDNRFSNDPVSATYGLERLERVYAGLAVDPNLPM